MCRDYTYDHDLVKIGREEENKAWKILGKWLRKEEFYSPRRCFKQTMTQYISVSISLLLICRTSLCVPPFLTP